MTTPKKNSAWGPLEVIVFALVCVIGFFFLAVALISPVKEPNTSPANACINNLRQIEAAKEEWAEANGITNGETVVSEFDITPYIQLDPRGNLPKCPSGGTYTIGKLKELPTCSLGTNVFPPHVIP